MGKRKKAPPSKWAQNIIHLLLAGKLGKIIILLILWVALSAYQNAGKFEEGKYVDMILGLISSLIEEFLKNFLL